MFEQYFSKLLDNIDKRMSDAKELMASGACADYPAYCSLVGLINGLRTARMAVVEMKEQADKQSL